jgi:hypothetical protein
MEMFKLPFSRRSDRIVTALVCIACIGKSVQPAKAVPSFAAQTGQPCQTCHIGALGPQLTPYGRNFKIKGYTLTGGTGLAADVHLALWIQTEYSNIKKNIPASGVTPDFANNDNLFINAVSLFYAGRITDHVGVFLQGTYDNVGKAFAIPTSA